MHTPSYMHTGLFGKKGRMLTVENKQVKHGLSISKLLEAVQLPKKVAVIHCRCHQKRDGEEIKRNNKADITAKKVGPETSNLATTRHTQKARSIQLLPNLHKGRIRQSPKMGLQ